MSHIATVSVIIKNTDALKAAAHELGCFFTEAKTFNSYQSGLPCDFKITVPGVRFEVGVQKQADGTYKLAWDTYGSGGGSLHGADGQKLLTKFGEGMGLLTQRYGVLVTEAQAKAKGMQVTRHWQDNGSCKLTINAGRTW